MKVPFFDVVMAQHEANNSIQKAISEVIQNGIFSGGEDVKRFNHQFAAYIGAPSFISCANGTDAIEIILRGLNLIPGAKIAVPSFSCEATVEPLYLLGLTPVFIPVNPQTYCMDPLQLKERITADVKAVLVVHLFGNAAEIESIVEICNENDCYLIEDCAQAHGLKIGNNHVGTFGDAAAFSFYPTKNLGALGEAGGIATSNSELATSFEKWVNHGQSSKNQHQFPGKNSRMDTLQASILSVKLSYLEKWNADRKEIAKIYYDSLSHIPGIQMFIQKISVHHIFPIHCDNRNELITFLEKEGIQTAIHYPYSLNIFEKEDIHNEHFVENILSLPCYPGLTSQQQKHVIQSIKKFYA